MSQVIFRSISPFGACAIRSSRLLTTGVRAAAVVDIQCKVDGVIHGYKLGKIDYIKDLDAKPHLKQLTKASGHIRLQKSDEKTDALMQTSPRNSAKDAFEKQNQASLDQLVKVAEAMTFHLPRFFTTPHPFSLYSKDVVFIDNVRQIRTQGVGPYATRMGLVKLYHRLRYSSSRCEVLNLVKHPEESCIRVRWRIVSKLGLVQFFFFFYKYHDMEHWTDGVSTLYVNSDGKIYCHVCDNIDIDQSKTEIKKTIKNPLVNRGLNV